MGAGEDNIPLQTGDNPAPEWLIRLRGRKQWNAESEAPGPQGLFAWVQFVPGAPCSNAVTARLREKAEHWRGELCEFTRCDLRAGGGSLHIKGAKMDLGCGAYLAKLRALPARSRRWVFPSVIRAFFGE